MKKIIKGIKVFLGFPILVYRSYKRMIALEDSLKQKTDRSYKSMIALENSLKQKASALDKKIQSLNSSLDGFRFENRRILQKILNTSKLSN